MPCDSATDNIDDIIQAAKGTQDLTTTQYCQ